MVVNKEVETAIFAEKFRKCCRFYMQINNSPAFAGYSSCFEVCLYDNKKIFKSFASDSSCFEVCLYDNKKIFKSFASDSSCFEVCLYDNKKIF